MLTKVIKLLFTWWNGYTIGTVFYTWRNGDFVGKDSFGNKYYSSRNEKKRWVIYDGMSEASKIEPNWHSWLRFLANETPSKETKKYKWQKTYLENLTGLSNAYSPQKTELIRDKTKSKLDADYSSWEPR